MTYRNNILLSARRSRVLLLILLSLFFISCTISDNLDSENNEQAVVILSMSTPKPALPTGFTRSGIDKESLISEVTVLVFEKSGEDYFFSYHAIATNLSNSDGNTQFKALLAAVNVPVKVLILANSNIAFLANIPSLGLSEAAVKNSLTLSFAEEALETNLPMYGEALLPQGIKPAETYSISTTMLRGVARVDVVKDLIQGTPDFIMEEVYLFRANDTIQLIPNELVGDVAPKVTTPSVPVGAKRLIAPLERIIPEGTESFTQLYVPESAPALTYDEKRMNASVIVVGGRFGSADNRLTYYRIDFNSNLVDHPFGQILRNYRYVFNIKNVSRDGWDTPEEAAENLSSSILVEVLAWEDFSTNLYFADDRFAISSREISLRYVANRMRKLDVESTYKYQIQWLENNRPVGDATSDYNKFITNDVFDALIVRDSREPEHVSHIVFRTRINNHAGDAVITRKLRITAGPWQVDVTVSQDNSAKYSKRHVNILSVNGDGHLGENMISNGASGMAMRQLLDAQFAPDGVIRIGGFSFTRMPSTSYYVGATQNANLFILERIFGGQDVIYFTKGTSISSPVADLLLAWLSNSFNRVLIIGTDTDDTNSVLRNKPLILVDGTWSFDRGSVVAPAYQRAPVTARSEEFFNGPFGAVVEGANFNRDPRTVAYTANRSDAVTPLVVSNTYLDYMTVGVNKSKRIVYMGDSNLFMTSQMSNNTGEVISDLDKLNANMWAWIIEQVIYGET